MNFGQAIEEAKAGNKIRRAGWNGKGMFVCYMPPLVLEEDMINDRTRKHLEGVLRRTAPGLEVGAYFVMWTTQEVWQPGWLASQPDMLSDDWEVVA